MNIKAAERKSHPVTEDSQALISLLLPTLPPVIAREEVERRLGGLVAYKTLANYDSRGQGPEVAFTVGRKVVYKTESLLTWVVTTFGIKRIVNNIHQL